MPACLRACRAWFVYDLDDSGTLDHEEFEKLITGVALQLQSSLLRSLLQL